MDKYIQLLESNLISEHNFLNQARLISRTHPAQYDAFSYPQTGRPRVHSTIPLSVQRAPIIAQDVDHQWDIVYGLLKSQQGMISLNEGFLDRDERRISLLPLRIDQSDVVPKLRAALIAVSIKHGVVEPLPGQPAYTGPVSLTTRNSVIFIAGQQIPVSAYLNPDPSKEWPEQMMQSIPSEPEPVATTIGYRPKDQKQLIFRVFTRYVERLNEISEAILELRGQELLNHPNIVISEHQIINRASRQYDESRELSLAVLLVALKYQVVSPLPGQTRYTGLIRYNPAVREVTVDNVPILPEHMAPGPSYEPPSEAQHPVSLYETLGTSPGASQIMPRTTFVTHWQQSFDLKGLSGSLLTESREILDLLSTFMTLPLDSVRITESSNMPEAGRWHADSNLIELNPKHLVHPRDTIIHEIGHWTASAISNKKHPSTAQEPFYATHAAIIDQYERNQDKYPLVEPDIFQYVGDSRELWARAFEGYFYLKLGHEGSCRVFDTTNRPPMLRNLAFWDRDEFAKYIFPSVEDIFVRSGLVQ